MNPAFAASAVIAARVVVGVAVALAVAIAWRSAQHRPVALALGLSLWQDLLRAYVPLGPHDALALYLLAPALFAWCALRVLAARRWLRALPEPALIWAVPFLAAVWRPETFWTAAPPAAHCAALVAEVVAAWRWWRSPRRRGGVSEACAIIFAAGDAVGLLGPLGLGGPWWIVACQAALVGVGLVGVQARALWIMRRQAGAGTRSGGEG